jgi:tRNA U34 5-carboxymethylaminomethyl modifying GTPase MnmE/TrmE
LQGNQSRVYSELKTRIIKVLAHVEAYIDFEDDETNDFSKNHTQKIKIECSEIIK